MTRGRSPQRFGAWLQVIAAAVIIGLLGAPYALSIVLTELRANGDVVSTANPLPVSSTPGTGAATSANQVTTNTEIGATNETAPATDTAPSGLNGREQRIAQRITSHLGIAQLPSYVVTATGYTAYATPTDLICISGSASKTIAITQFYLGIQSTAAALQNIYFIKRSTANTGGTSTTPTPIAYDSSRSAATAVVTVYTAAPTLGSAVGTVRLMQNLSGTLTAAPGTLSLSIQGFVLPTRIQYQTPFILRGTAESLCANYNTAALTSGFTSTYGVEWVEFTSADD